MSSLLHHPLHLTEVGGDAEDGEGDATITSCSGGAVIGRERVSVLPDRLRTVTVRTRTDRTITAGIAPAVSPWLPRVDSASTSQGRLRPAKAGEEWNPLIPLHTRTRPSFAIASGHADGDSGGSERRMAGRLVFVFVFVSETVCQVLRVKYVLQVLLAGWPHHCTGWVRGSSSLTYTQFQCPAYVFRTLYPAVLP